jgi:hypothetical protein
MTTDDPDFPLDSIPISQLIAEPALVQQPKPKSLVLEKEGWGSWNPPGSEDQIRAQHRTWTPRADEREAKIQEKLRGKTIEELRDTIPDEAQMIALEYQYLCECLDLIPAKYNIKSRTHPFTKCSYTDNEAFKELSKNKSEPFVSVREEDGATFIHFEEAPGGFYLGGRPLASTRPSVLKKMPIEKLGVSVGDRNGEDIIISSGLSWKTRRINPENHARCIDFTEEGWPKCSGNPVRWVTGEEEREIRQRLAQSGLTMPGSEVALVSHSLSEIMRMQIPKPKWIINGWLREGGSTMIFGAPSVGKTWLTQSLILLAASGPSVFILDGLLETGDGAGIKVLLIDGEMILGDLQERTDIIFQQSRPFDTFDKIQVYAKTDQDPRAKFPDLVDPSWKNRLISEAKGGGYKLVVFDNLSTLCPCLEDENSSVAWNPLNELIVALKREGIATLLIHHTGKTKPNQKATFRGSSNIVTTLETSIALDQIGGEKFDGASLHYARL